MIPLERTTPAGSLHPASDNRVLQTVRPCEITRLERTAPHRMTEPFTQPVRNESSPASCRVPGLRQMITPSDRAKSPVWSRQHHIRRLDPAPSPSELTAGTLPAVFSVPNNKPQERTEKMEKNVYVPKKRGRSELQIDTDLFFTVCKKWRAGEMTARQAVYETGLSTRTFYRRAHRYGFMSAPVPKTEKITITMAEYERLKVIEASARA